MPRAYATCRGVGETGSRRTPAGQVEPLAEPGWLQGSRQAHAPEGLFLLAAGTLSAAKMLLDAAKPPCKLVTISLPCQPAEPPVNGLDLKEQQLALRLELAIQQQQETANQGEQDRYHQAAGGNHRFPELGRAHPFSRLPIPLKRRLARQLEFLFALPDRAVRRPL